MCSQAITIQAYDPLKRLRSYAVPCGKCLDCVRQYQNDWMVRLVEECRNWSEVHFLTLTYRDKPYYDRRKHKWYNSVAIPMVVDTDTGEVFYSVCKKHLQDAFKRFRKNGGYTSSDFKYFITSEYGPLTFRPHYHAIIFGLSYSELGRFLNDWEDRYGFTYYERVKNTPKDRMFSCRYLAKYCNKGEFENPYVKEGIVQKTFHLISKGIGKSYVYRYKDYHLGIGLFSRVRNHYSKEHIAFICENRFVRLEANSKFRYHMPRYYRENIYPKGYLQIAIEDYLFKKHSLDIEQKSLQLSTQRNISFHEAFGIVSWQVDQEIAYKSVLARASLNKFYNRSKL